VLYLRPEKKENNRPEDTPVVKKLTLSLHKEEADDNSPLPLFVKKENKGELSSF